MKHKLYAYRADIQRVPKLIGQLYQAARALHELFPERPFTLDGHLVGNIGEVIAAYTYGLTLTDKAVNPGFDARTADGRTVEVKLTAGKSVSVSSDPKVPDCLVVLKYHETEGFCEIYSGEFPVELWDNKNESKRRVKSLRLNELAGLVPVRVLRQKNALVHLNRLFGQRPTRV